MLLWQLSLLCLNEIQNKLFVTQISSIRVFWNNIWLICNNCERNICTLLKIISSIPVTVTWTLVRSQTMTFRAGFIQIKIIHWFTKLQEQNNELFLKSQKLRRTLLYSFYFFPKKIFPHVWDIVTVSQASINYHAYHPKIISLAALKLDCPEMETKNS